MLLNFKQPGNYLPHTIKEIPSLAINFKPPTEPHYIVQATGNLPKRFTGILLNRVQFVNGIAYLKTLYDVKLAVTRGCKDITPDDYKEYLDNRELNKILVIRNAAFGDGLLLTPALKALRLKYPDAEIHIFGRKNSRVVYENLPFIDGILSLRETELGAIVDEYDEVFDLMHSIECRPEADFMNALDVAAGILGVEIEDTRSIYNMTSMELEEAQRLLLDLGIVPGKDRLIIIQAEASAKVRTLPYVTSLIVANQLAMKGFKVLFVGHDPNLPSARMLVHEDKNGNVSRLAEPVPPGIESVVKSTPEGEVRYSVASNHGNIQFAHVLNHKYRARVHFATCAFASLVISVDSFWSHLAPALDKPCVTIYSNYHPFTRTKYYDNTSIVTPDYSRVTCGPCNGLFDTCPMYKQAIAPCIGTVKPKDILDAAFERLDNKMPLFQQLRDTPPAVLEEVRPCPMCGSSKSDLVTCKGSFIYSQCNYCESIFTIKYPDLKFWKKLKSLVKKNPHYRSTRNAHPKIFIEAISQGFKNCDLKLPKIPVVDLISTPDKFHERESWKELFPDYLVQVNEDSKKPIESNLVLWVDGLMEQEYPVEKLANIFNRMKPEAYLAIMVPITNRYDKINTWKPLNAPVAGLNTVIPSQDSFKILFDKDSGIFKDDCKLIFINTSEEASIILLQRTKESENREISWKRIN